MLIDVGPEARSPCGPIQYSVLAVASASGMCSCAPCNTRSAIPKAMP
jgi:hypothetical protein